MRRRFAHWPARVLMLLALLLPTIPVALGADAVLRALAPSSARPGEEIVVEGTGMLPSPGGGSVLSTIRYGDSTNAIRGDLTSSDWSGTRVRVRLPPAIGPGAYWLALYRNGVLSSNRLNFTVALVARAAPITSTDVPVAGALASARIVDGPECSGHSVISLSGGPFQPGTDSAATVPDGYVLLRVVSHGQTGVEVSASDDATENAFWNRLIYRVRVVNERELEVQIGRCFVIQKRPRIRAFLPNGARTNWVDVRR